MWQPNGGVVYTDNATLKDALLKSISDSCITHKSRVNRVPHWHVTCPASRAADARRICEGIEPRGEVKR